MTRIAIRTALVFGVLLWTRAGMPVDTATGNYVEPATGLSFPASLGPLKRTGVTTFKEAELGIMIGYRGSDLVKADVYVYQGRDRNMAPGVQSEAVKSQLKEIKDAVLEVERRGYYKDVLTGKDETLALATPSGDIALLRTYFRFEQTPRAPSPGRRISYAFLTVYQGRFLKIRFTYLLDKKADGEKALQGFLADFAKTFPAAEK